MDGAISYPAQTVIPAVPELFTERRGDKVLLLNPRGPAWAVGGAATAAALYLADGARSIADLYDLLCVADPALTPAEVERPLTELLEAGFFAEGRRGEIAPLVNVVMNVTRTCNLACPFCYYDSGPDVKERAQAMMRVDDWLRVADQVVALAPYGRITVMGGEPFAWRGTMDLLEGLAERGLSITVVTNGMLLQGDRVARLAKLRNLTIQMSIDSLDPKVNAVQRGPEHLDKALENLARLQEAGIRCVVSMTQTRKNLGSWAELKRFCDDTGIYLRMSGFFAVGDRSQEAADEYGLSSEEFLDLTAQNMAESPAFRNEQLQRRLTPGRVNWGCGVGHGTIAIHPDGMVSPCNHISGAERALGNVRETDLDEIVTRGRTAYGHIDVDQMPAHGCGGCPVRYLCGGGCKADSLLAFGTTRRPPPNCHFLKRVQLDALWADLLGFEESPLHDRAINLAKGEE